MFEPTKTKYGFALLTNKDACELLDISMSTLIRWRKKGYFGYAMIGGTPRYKYEELAIFKSLRLLESIEKTLRDEGIIQHSTS